MEIMDVAVMLGKMIKNSEEGRALDLAKAEWAECEELRTAYTEYSAQHNLLVENRQYKMRTANTRSCPSSFSRKPSTCSMGPSDRS